MPVTTGPACLSSVSCPIILMPVTEPGCVPVVSAGGVNDLYFIPCTEAMTEANVLLLDWWTGLIGDVANPSKLGNIGLGIGSIGKKTTKSEKVASCRPEQITSVTWALKYTIKVIDKTSADKTRAQVTAMLQRFSNFQVIARMCDGADTVLPIGAFSTSDIDWVVPEDSADIQSISFELSWIEFALPKPYTVAGLSAIVPKA